MPDLPDSTHEPAKHVLTQELVGLIVLDPADQLDDPDGVGDAVVRGPQLGQAFHLLLHDLEAVLDHQYVVGEFVPCTSVCYHAPHHVLPSACLDKLIILQDIRTFQDGPTKEFLVRYWIAFRSISTSSPNFPKAVLHA